jgi:hypothetical protein
VCVSVTHKRGLLVLHALTVGIPEGVDISPSPLRVWTEYTPFHPPEAAGVSVIVDGLRRIKRKAPEIVSPGACFLVALYSGRFFLCLISGLSVRFGFPGIKVLKMFRF